jgi:hypothetical protein
VQFFYERRLDADALAHALGRVLGDYCVFNGRVARRGAELYLECNDNGVALSVVRADTDMRTALGQLDSKDRKPLVDTIDAKRALAKGDPLFTVRITHFTDDTSCLGLCWHHSVGDMHSFMGLMQAWSRAVAGLDHASPLVVEDREAYLAQELPETSRPEPGVRHLGFGELAGLAYYMLTKARDQARARFYFAPDELERLRASLQTDGGERISINDALCAHMFSLIAARAPRVRSRQLSIAINYRKRVGLPNNLLGNMITGLHCVCEPGTPAGRIAGQLRHGVNHFAEEHMDYRTNVRFIESRGGAAKIGRFLMKSIDPIAGTLLVTNWSKFGVYDVTFGGEPPSFFMPAGEVPFPWLSAVSDGFHGRGLIYSVVLPSAVARRLVDDDGVREVHRFRDEAAPLPEIGRSVGGLR